jgi:DNA repair ATPase RecN
VEGEATAVNGVTSGNPHTPAINIYTTGTTTPVQNREVSGGKVADVDAQIQTDWEKAYKGLQPKLEQRTNEARELQEQMAALQRQIEELSGARATKEQEVTQLSQTTQELEQRATAESVKAEMYRLVATEYQELGPMLETLQPRATVDDTKQMLTGLREAVRSAAQAQTKQQVGNYNSVSGNAGRGEDMSLEALRERAISVAGTREYPRAAAEYYAQIQKSGDYPKPKADPFDDILN